MDTLFRSKFNRYSIVLKSSKEEIVETNNGKRTRRIPSVVVKFENGMFDAKKDGSSLPYDTEELVKELKKQPMHGKEFWHVEEPLTAQKLVSKGIRELRDDGELDEVTSGSKIMKAIELEKEKEKPRTTALDILIDKAQEMGIEYVEADDEEEAEDE